jgi:hypothetical protein
MRDQQDVRDLLEVREKDYGDSWKLTGRIIALMIPYRDQFITYPDNHPESFGKYWHPVLMIVVKLCRALVSPQNLDHWKDIQGYAQLVIDDFMVDEQAEQLKRERDALVRERRDTGT